MLISNDTTVQGFTVIETVLGGTEVAELSRTLETSDLDRSRAGARHLMNRPAVSAVAADPRMVAIARRFLGQTAIPTRRRSSTSLPPGTGSSPGTRTQRCRFVNAARFPSGVRGRPRQASPMLSRLPPPWRRWWLCACTWMIRVQTTDRCACFQGRTCSALTESDIARLTTDVPAVDCVAPAGSVVAMRPLIVHASSKAESDLPRRVLHIEYARSLDCGDVLRLRLA
jgi:hypothetical protein